MSDLHSEETVESREVNGLNSYDLKEAGIRFQRLVRKQVEYVARYVWMAREVVWPILGDLINGVLREQALEANDASVMQTLAIIGPWFDAAIDYSLREYKALGLPVKKIIIPCVCGNHGRAYKKLGDRVAWKNSYEWGFYQALAARWAHDPRVDFRIADADFCFLTIFGRTIRFHHGDAIHYGGGILGLSVPVHKKINRWNKSIRAELDIFGHYHQLQWGGDFVCNGSVVGYNSYAQRIGCEYEPPQQAFLLFDKKWGLVHTSTGKGGAGQAGNIYDWIGPVEFGVWTDFVIHIKLSNGSDGIIELYNTNRLTDGNIKKIKFKDWRRMENEVAKK